MGITDIAKEVRAELKEKHPECKFSVRTKQFSGGCTLEVALMAAPFNPFDGDTDVNGNPHDGTYAQLNHYYINHIPRDGRWSSNGYYLTPKAAHLLKDVVQISNKRNWDRSDPMIDYFDVNYYFHLSIGQWDKPFEVIS